MKDVAPWQGQGCKTSPLEMRLLVEDYEKVTTDTHADGVSHHSRGLKEDCQAEDDHQHP